MILLLSLLIGVVAGLRAMMAPAAVSWASFAKQIEASYAAECKRIFGSIDWPI